jgi:peptidoglycan/LPS O-acetylase OafA/YrhL
MSDRPASRLPALDGIRGLAILLVLAHNTTLDPVAPTAADRRVLLLLDVGWIGVQLFFVLSGFLITRILLETPDSHGYYRDFYMRRVLRIFPLYYGALLFFFVLLPALHAVPHDFHATPGDGLAMALYVYNWTMPFSDGAPLPHLWSLAVEEQFYLLWPFVVHGRSPRSVWRLCLWIAAASLAARVGLRLAGVSGETIYPWSVSRMDAIALGAAAAALTQMPQAWARVVSHRRWLGVAAALLFVAGVLATHSMYARTELLGQTIGYSILALVFTLLVLAAAAGPQAPSEAGIGPQRWMLSTPLRALGRYSYGLYIIHQPIHAFVARPWMKAHGWSPAPALWVSLAYLIALTLACTLLAMLLYHGVEKHFLALKRHFAASARTAASPS